MIQLEQQQHGSLWVGGGVRWLTPTTYIQLAGAGSKKFHTWLQSILNHYEKIDNLYSTVVLLGNEIENLEKFYF